MLIIGIDGCRPDALAAAETPHLDALIKNGTYFEGTDIVSPDRKNPANTVSGPGWSNLLCGIWPDKHGVLDNKFTEPKYDQFPHFFCAAQRVAIGCEDGFVQRLEADSRQHHAGRGRGARFLAAG